MAKVKKQYHNTKKKLSPAAKAVMAAAGAALLFTAGLFMYAAYSLTGTVCPTAELFDGRPTVRFVDVGQGDCTLVTWQGDAVLIDAGPGSAGRKSAEYVKLYAPVIDCLIITHPHEDHMGGAADIINSVKVSRLVMSDIEVDDVFYRSTLEAAQRRGTEIIVLSDAVSFSEGCIQVEILDTFGFEYEDLNDASLITRITVGGTEILLTGDAEQGEENYLVENYPDSLDCDILKAGHHGSKSSSGEEFLRAADPEICVISVGRGNSYGHPSDEVVRRIEEYGAQIHRTDREGHVVLRGEGESGRGLIDAVKSVMSRGIT